MLYVAVGAFLILHGLIHLGYVTPRPDDPKYPFAPERAWIVRAGLEPGVAKGMAVTLAAITVVAYTISGIALFANADLWQPTAVIGSIASLVLLVLTFHPWLLLGVAIDVAIIASITLLHWPEALYAP